MGDEKSEEGPPTADTWFRAKGSEWRVRRKGDRPDGEILFHWKPGYSMRVGAPPAERPITDTATAGPMPDLVVLDTDDLVDLDEDQ